MEALSPGIFVVPTIALALLILLYFNFARQVRDKEKYRNYITWIALIAFLLNFIWEVGQGPLYEGFKYDARHISFCALASIVDMLMVLILLFGFGLLYHNVFWIKRLTIIKVSSLVVVGTVGAIIAEIWHTARGDWDYAEAMPIVPYVEMGLLPILQFAVLPLIIFLAGVKLINEENLEI